MKGVLHMRTKINCVLGKIPVPILLIFMVIINITDGYVVSKINVTEAGITHAGFTTNLFKTLLVCYGITIVCVLIDKLFHKTYRNKILNISYTKLLSRVLSSKMSDIQSVSTGKIFDAVKDISSLTADVGLYVIWIIPTIMPFITLIKSEFNTDWRMAVISITSVMLTFIFTMLSDRLFRWNTEAKRKKANLQGITVDNFMNIKTIKYLKQGHFAMKRLDDAQKDSWSVCVNPTQVLYFRIIDVIGIAPLLINLYLSRNNLEMIALLFLSNYTLDNMRYHTLGIAETIIELKAQKDIIKNLKGDDNEELLEIDDSLTISNVMFDYGEDSVKFYIDELNFEKNSRTLVYGESGEGKSSLANLIAGGIHPTTGDVPRYNVYYIWQETESLDDTLWNNIVFDNPYHINENEVIGLFKELNMLDWFGTLKNGFRTQIGERGCRLSSGQKQRLNIIRLILEMRYDPNKIFIIDEITSNLDSVTRELAINLIDKECHSTLICISHNEGFDKICKNRILVRDHKFINVE